MCAPFSVAVLLDRNLNTGADVEAGEKPKEEIENFVAEGVN